MVTRPQPDGIERDLDVLRTIIVNARATSGSARSSTTPGTVAVGDPLAGSLAQHVLPGDALVDAGFAGQAEHALADDVLHHLVGTARDVRGGRAEQRLVPAVVVVGRAGDARRPDDRRARARPSAS